MEDTVKLGIGMTSERTRKRLVLRLSERGICNTSVLEAIANTPRHLFIDEALAHRAYEDTALPIGLGQTISQPFTVARMTELLLGETSLEKVLEIGTGSGYQAAILAQLVNKLYTVECLPSLITKARNRFRHLGLRNIVTHHGNGAKGWEKYQPYDGIIVTAAARKVPEKLLEQLKVGGRMVIPVAKGKQQQLQVILRHTTTEFETTNHEVVNFVPLVDALC